MGWFDTKQGDKRREEISSLPDLPALPEFPRIKEETKLPKLPAYPHNTFGEKFSQNVIKDAVSGKEEDDLEEEADEFAPYTKDRMQMMQKPLTKPMTREVQVKRSTLTREISEEPENPSGFETRIPEPFVEAARKVKKAEPVFVRLDKFEESIKTFDETKKKIGEIEKLLRDINKVKEEEEKELNTWQNEIQIIKKKIDKIDQEIFSKIE